MKTYKRDSKGKFTASGFVKWTVVVLMIASSIGLYGAYRASPVVFERSGEVAKKVETAMQRKDRLDKVIDEDKKMIDTLKGEIAEKLRGLESAGIKSTKDTLFFAFDPNSSERKMCQKSGGKMNLICISVGEFMTKIPTLIEMYRKEKGVILTEREAFELALNTEKMSKFIPEVLINQVGSCNAWTACTNNKEWFQSKIDKVRFLQEEIIRFEAVK